MNEKEKLVTKLLNKAFAEARKMESIYSENRNKAEGDEGYLYARITIFLDGDKPAGAISCNIHDFHDHIELYDGVSRQFISKTDILKISTWSYEDRERGER